MVEALRHGVPCVCTPQAPPHSYKLRMRLGGAEDGLHGFGCAHGQRDKAWVALAAAFSGDAVQSLPAIPGLIKEGGDEDYSRLPDPAVRASP